MGRIIAQTEITNPLDEGDEGKSVAAGMLVDIGAGALVLPVSWKEKLGNFLHEEPVELGLANGDTVRGEACAPVKIEIEGFRLVFNEVLFIAGEDAEPLIGYVILEQAQAAVDMVGHRLVRVPYVDLR